MQGCAEMISSDYIVIIKTIGLDIIQRITCGPNIPEKVKLVKLCSDWKTIPFQENLHPGYLAYFLRASCT